MGDWISVDERLPDKGVPVLAIDGPGEDAGIFIAVLDSDGWLEQDCTLYGNGKWQSDGVWASVVTHWQPLPEPPEVQG